MSHHPKSIKKYENNEKTLNGLRNRPSMERDCARIVSHWGKSKTEKLIAIGAASARLKTVRRLLTILSCLLFVGQMFAQTLPECAVQAPRVCACAHCDGMCCATKQNSDSRSPATPLRSVSQNQFLIAALATMTSTPMPVASARQNFSFADSSFNVSAVPIFQRNCSILI